MNFGMVTVKELVKLREKESKELLKRHLDELEKFIDERLKSYFVSTEKPVTFFIYEKNNPSFKLTPELIELTLKKYSSEWNVECTHKSETSNEYGRYKFTFTVKTEKPE